PLRDDGPLPVCLVLCLQERPGSLEEFMRLAMRPRPLDQVLPVDCPGPVSFARSVRQLVGAVKSIEDILIRDRQARRVNPLPLGLERLTRCVDPGRVLAAE